jgi:uncharacterized protein (DUF486 family)
MTRAKPFTTIAALLFLLAAVVHAFRLYAGFNVVLGSHVIPVAASWGFALGALLLGVMLLREARR